MKMRIHKSLTYLTALLMIFLFTGCAEEENEFIGRFDAELKVTDITQTSATFELRVSKDVVEYGYNLESGFDIWINGKHHMINSWNNSIETSSLPNGGKSYKWKQYDLTPGTNYKATTNCRGKYYRRHEGENGGIDTDYNRIIASATADFTTLPKEQGEIIVSDITPTSASFEIKISQATYDMMGEYKELRYYLNGNPYSLYDKEEDWEGKKCYNKEILSDGRVSLSWKVYNLAPQTEYKFIYECGEYTNINGDIEYFSTAESSFTTLPLGEWVQEPFYCITDNSSSYVKVRCSSPSYWSFTPGFAYTLHLISMEDSSVNYEFHPSEMSTHVCMFNIQKKNAAKGMYTYYLEGTLIQDETGYQAPDNTKMRPSESSPAYIVI